MDDERIDLHEQYDDQDEDLEQFYQRCQEQDDQLQGWVREQDSAMRGQSQVQDIEVLVDIDQIINKLIKVGDEKPGKHVEITQDEIYGLVNIARQIFMHQNSLLQIEAPIQICGDIHGQYYDLLRLFAYGGMPPQSKYLFLGDYVDRGNYGVQTICLLFCLKIKYPNNFYLLRGNHESTSITKIYGFYNQCKKRFGNIKIWKCFLSAFVYLPVAAIINQRILCMHGGLSPFMLQVSDINEIKRPQEVPDHGLLCDLLWADPTKDITGWAESERGCSFMFGSEVSSVFMKVNDLDLVCRAHQVVEDGYQFCHKKRIVTVFSAPNYCGQFNNAGAFMKVDAQLCCSFHILKPQNKITPFKNTKQKIGDMSQAVSTQV